MTVVRGDTCCVFYDLALRRLAAAFAAGDARRYLI
jgi:hypothetical protein